MNWVTRVRNAIPFIAKRETAEILNGLIRNIEYTSNADVAYDTALDHAVTGGFGYFRIDVDYACDDEFDLDIKMCRIANPLTVYGNENSTAADSSDWNKAFITELYTDSETGAINYGTTELLLEVLGINSLDEMPLISPFLPDANSNFDVVI